MFDHLTLMNLQLYVIQYKTIQEYSTARYTSVLFDNSTLIIPQFYVIQHTTIQEYSTAGFVAVLFYHNIKKNKIPSNKCNHNHQSFQ